MYHDSQGREIEDLEMDNMRRDAEEEAKHAVLSLGENADATLTSDGHLIVRNESFIVTIDAGQAWNLLQWLTDYHLTSLYQLVQDGKTEE